MLRSRGVCALGDLFFIGVDIIGEFVVGGDVCRPFQAGCQRLFAVFFLTLISIAEITYDRFHLKISKSTFLHAGASRSR